ncbi:MAG: DHH family phosphoesterase, partial [Bacteroidota bacterium]
MKDAASLRDYLSNPRRIVITTHANPDADALGSSLGLFHFLHGNRHHVDVVVPTSYPDFLNWMPANEKVINYEDDQKAGDELLSQAELLFCLDFSGFNRIKLMKNQA